MIGSRLLQKIKRLVGLGRHGPAQPNKRHGPRTGDPQRLGELLPDVDPRASAQRRTDESINEMTALLAKAGQMLEGQAKRQQQLTDNLADLPELIRSQMQQLQQYAESVSQIHGGIERGGKDVGELHGSMSQLAGRLDAIEAETKKLGEILGKELGKELGEKLGQKLDQKIARLAEGFEQLATVQASQLEMLEALRQTPAALDDLRKLIEDRAGRLRKLLIVALALSASAVIAAIVMGMVR